MTVPRPRSTALGSVLVIATLVLGLTACDDDAPEPSTPPSVASSAPTAQGGGTYNATLPTGAIVRITLPADPPPDSKVEGLRKDAGIERAVYATIGIDNSRGTRPVSVKRLMMTAQDGAEYRLDALPGVVRTWAPQQTDHGTWKTRGGRTLDAARAQSLNDRVTETAARYSGDVPVGSRGEEILVGDLDNLPASFTSMELVPSMGDVEETPVQPSPDRANAPDAPRPVSPAAPKEPEGKTRRSDPPEERPRKPESREPEQKPEVPSEPIDRPDPTHVPDPTEAPVDPAPIEVPEPATEEPDVEDVPPPADAAPAPAPADPPVVPVPVPNPDPVAGGDPVVETDTDTEVEAAPVEHPSAGARLPVAANAG